ncbi:hypothetical protein H4582DRAFT_1446755 [Lactarius indigo]|nr:hypothetical protein H4582DRAFT_1446755 [Lactarius indigo]
MSVIGTSRKSSRGVPGSGAAPFGANFPKAQGIVHRSPAWVLGGSRCLGYSIGQLSWQLVVRRGWGSAHILLQIVVRLRRLIFPGDNLPSSPCANIRCHIGLLYLRRRRHKCSLGPSFQIIGMFFTNIGSRPACIDGKTPRMGSLHKPYPLRALGLFRSFFRAVCCVYISHFLCTFTHISIVLSDFTFTFSTGDDCLLCTPRLAEGEIYVCRPFAFLAQLCDRVHVTFWLSWILATYVLSVGVRTLFLS